MKSELTDNTTGTSSQTVLMSKGIKRSSDPCGDHRDQPCHSLKEVTKPNTQHLRNVKYIHGTILQQLPIFPTYFSFKAILKTILALKCSRSN